MKWEKWIITALLSLCLCLLPVYADEMEAVIKEYGGDMSLVDTVVTTYASEKSLKKAWYMSELQKRGFI